MTDLVELNEHATGGPTEANPLAEIEHHVQQRAKSEALDVERRGGRERLAVLVHEEVARWNEQFARGSRPFPLSDPDGIAERALRNLAGYGPLAPLLDDPDVWEIMVNGPTSIFVKRHRGPSGFHDEAFHDDDHVARTLTKIFDDASGAHRKLDPSEGLQDAQLDGGARLHLVHADLARDGHVLVNIRKFTGLPIKTLHELVAHGTIDQPVAAFLGACVQARASMVFAGAPGSGKTTLLSCCAAELDPALRVVIAEEVFEADVPVANCAQMQTRAARADRPEIDLRRLVAGFLRMAPDVAIVGEVRDREALPLLLTLSSGVKGFTTIHAGSARQALTRLRFLCQLADAGAALPMSALNHLVSEAVDVVVHSMRGPRGFQVTSVVAVEDLVGPADGPQLTVTEVFSRPAPDAPLTWTGQMPARLQRTCAEHGVELANVLEGL